MACYPACRLSSDSFADCFDSFRGDCRANVIGVKSAPEISTNSHLQSNVQDGVILHAFNWSYNAIKEKLPEIAAAGYSAVQTSPVQ